MLGSVCLLSQLSLSHRVNITTCPEGYLFTKTIMAVKGLQLSQPLAAVSSSGKFDSIAKEHFLSDHINLALQPPHTTAIPGY